MSFDSHEPFRFTLPPRRSAEERARAHDAAASAAPDAPGPGDLSDPFDPPAHPPLAAPSGAGWSAGAGAGWPVVSAADTCADAAPDTDDRPSPAPGPAQRRHDGWSPDSRRVFLETLSECPNVRRAAERAGLSHTAAYREKRVNPDFSRAWEAALVIGRDHMEQLLYDRAVYGVEEEIVYHGVVTATRVRHYPRLLLALLGRLDARAEHDDSRRGAARFHQVLDAVGKGEDAAPLFDVPLPHEEEHYDPYAAHADVLDGYAPEGDRLDMLMAGIEDMERDWPG